MTPQQLNEAMRLASVYAKQRAYRAGVIRKGDGTRTVERAQAELRVAKAEKNLRDYLAQFLTNQGD